MNRSKRFISIKAKIITSTLIPVFICFAIMCSVIFVSLFQSLNETAKAEFLQISQKHTVTFEHKINQAINYLSIVAVTLELQVEKGLTDREMLQETILGIFESSGEIDGSSIYFEPNAYDGKDADYIGTSYGTEQSGRICYYFYVDNGETSYLPEALTADVEFELPHYTEAKRLNKPIYTEPSVYEIDGRSIPMFTITYPIHDWNNRFIGAVTVDLFLDDICTLLNNENIYKTGYVVIGNDKEGIIYSPRYEDIGKTRKEAGIDYPLPADDVKSFFFNAKSILNGQNTLVTMETIYIPQLNSRFYLSVSAPITEINAVGIRLTALLITFSVLILIAIASWLYYLTGKRTTPIKALTESANSIANGKINDETIYLAVDFSRKRYIDEIDMLYESINKMLVQLNGMQALKWKTRELALEKERAESAAQAKIDFLAKMSHEIRTPMNAVMGMTELILRKELPQDVYEDALVIKSASTNLLSIINDILDFSKIDAGKLEVSETGYTLFSLLNDVINTIRIQLVDKPVQFIVDVDSRVPSLLIGDEIRIRQILVNLLNNAVKYTNEGYISLKMWGVVTSENTVQLTIEIKDSGIGIKEEDLSQLFGDFVQVDTATNRGIEGTGLGLAIARQLCRLMGGDITAQSQYGQGSIFTVTLPQQYETYEPIASVAEPESKSVLLYETRTYYKNSIQQTLSDLKVVCESVDNIPALFDRLGQHPYVFISSFMYNSIQPVLSRMKDPPMLVLVADITETLAPRDIRMLTMPAYALSVADILNDVYDETTGMRLVGASFIAPDAAVLVVDDVAANLKVAEGLMIPYGMQVTLCPSGQKAVALAAANHFDLIFMDHMMPEMDGLEVTRRIRALEGVSPTLPIIALSANAVSGVREMFIQNGMNDFLSKPIDIKKLDAILHKWIPKEKQRKIKKKEASSEKSDFVEKLKSVPELSVDKALSVVGGSLKTYEKTVKLSIRLLPDNIARLNSLLETDLTHYAIEVHGIKGVLNNIGAYGLGNAAYELEHLSTHKDWDACRAQHPAFIARLTQFENVMKVLVEQSEVAAGVHEKVDGDQETWEQFIRKMQEAVDSYDSIMAQEILSSVKGFTFGTERDKGLADLLHACECFAFDQAEELIEVLK